jgi:hypothetical protein
MAKNRNNQKYGTAISSERGSLRKRGTRAAIEAAMVRMPPLS